MAERDVVGRVGREHFRRCVDRCLLFRGLDPETREGLSLSAEPRWAKRKEAFSRQGHPARLVFLLCSGRVKISQIGQGHEEVIVRVIGPGELFGGLGMVAGAPYAATAEALEATHAASWDRRTMDELFRRFPVLSRNALRIMAGRLRDLEERYRELATEPVAQRLAHALLRLVAPGGRQTPASLDFSLSREDLAHMTGTTLFTVSRLISEWESQGLLVARRQGVSIRDPDGLLGIAQELPRRGRRPSKH